jgi:hypothetical protein
MAPERFQGRGDERADIYALTLTLYELLVLRPAFDARDRQPTRGQGGGAVSACCFVQTSEESDSNHSGQFHQRRLALAGMLRQEHQPLDRPHERVT